VATVGFKEEVNKLEREPELHIAGELNKVDEELRKVMDKLKLAV